MAGNCSLLDVRLRVDELEVTEYRAAGGLYGGRSFLQTPAWAEVKSGWSSQLLGWRDPAGRLVGTALVLLRRVPGPSRWFAYLPEGPDIDWTDFQLERWLDPLLNHLERQGVFAVRMGPPLPLRRWSAANLKAAGGPGRRIDHVLPDLVEPAGSAVVDRLRALGWQRAGDDGTAGDAQPRYVFQVPFAGRPDDLVQSFDQQWRRNIRKALNSRVETMIGGYGQLGVFYELLKLTEQRNGFRLGRSLEYYERQYRALNGEQTGTMRLYLSSYQGEVLAAHTMNVVGRRVWYQTGASADHRREVRPSHILQWTMMRDARQLGAEYYDMRGVSSCLDPEDPAYGLLRWKLGTRGEVVETVGEWERPLPGPINHALHRAFVHHRRRGATGPALGR